VGARASEDVRVRFADEQEMGERASEPASQRELKLARDI
jgi:hypothetical protein